MKEGYIIISFKIKEEERKNKYVEILLKTMVDTLTGHFEGTIHNLNKLKSIDISIEPILIDDDK